MSGHTPGEWDYWQEPDFGYYHISSLTHGILATTESGEDAEANARLMAKAPKLLEKAKNVLHEVFLNAGAPDSEARITEALSALAEAAADAEGTP